MLSAGEWHNKGPDTMTTAMARLQEKAEHQRKIAVNLKQRFRDAVDIAMNDGGFCWSEVQCFGRTAFDEILKELQQES